MRTVGLIEPKTAKPGDGKKADTKGKTAKPGDGKKADTKGKTAKPGDGKNSAPNPQGGANE